LLRALEGIAAQDWLPNGAPNGVLEPDTSKIPDLVGLDQRSESKTSLKAGEIKKGKK